MVSRIIVADAQPLFRVALGDLLEQHPGWEVVAEAENIPGITLEIIDIGLTVEEALRIGCDSEPFEDDDELPSALRATLTDLELEYFGERQIRFEINGIDPDERIGYRQLTER